MRPTDSFGASLRTSHNTSRLVIAAMLFVGLWELAARIISSRARFPDHILPTLEQIVRSFNELSNYWRGGLGVRSTELGGEETFAGAVLALVDNTLITASRLGLGMLLAFILGVGSGLLIGYLRAVRRFAFGPLNFLGVLPLLAMVPLFAFWFGATTQAAVLLIAFGAGITLLRTTLNAVENVPRIYVDVAQTMGAKRAMIYRTVIIPAILPELRGGVTIALTFSWSVALGAELIGIQTGLGRMMVLAMRFSEVDRMVIIAVAFVLLAATTVISFNRISDRLIRWPA